MTPSINVYENGVMVNTAHNSSVNPHLTLTDQSGSGGTEVSIDGFNVLFGSG